MAVVPHLRIPFRISNGGSADVLEQDSQSEIAQSVAVLVRTRVGERPTAPDYGISDPTFLTSPSSVMTSIKLQVEEHEDRAEVAITSEVDAYDELTRSYRVHVRPKVDVVPAAPDPADFEGLSTGPVPNPGGLGPGSTWDSLGVITWDDLGGSITWDQI